MRTSDMVKSKYWRARDVEGRAPVVLTIAEVTEEIFSRGGKQEVKCFLWFMEGIKGLQLNRGRVASLEYAFGPDSDAWLGRKVKLSYDPTVMFGDKAVGGVKLETPPNAIYRGAAAAAAPVAIPPGAPPPPVWNGREWVMQAPPPAAPAMPPPPVWNAATGQWDVVNPGTGEISPPAATAAPPAAPVHVPPKTISQRVAEGTGADPEWPTDYQPLSKAGQDFDDDIPF